MATLNTLRTRGALFLSIVIGVALIAFLLGDLTGASSIFYNRRNRVGSINGNNVEYMEFVRGSDDLSRIVQTLYGKNSLTSEETDEVRDMVWQSYIREYVYDPGFRKMGLTVAEGEQLDMIRGQYISPVIAAIFSSPETGMYDPAYVEDFLANMEYDQGGNMSSVWQYLKDEMNNERTVSKYMSLVQNGAYVTDLEVEQGVRAANNRYSARYVTIPYSQIADSLVKVSSGEIKRYYREHKNQFRQAASRDIEYVLFDLMPSESDSAEAEVRVNSIAAEFAAAESPMQYASLNSQDRTDAGYYSEEQLPTDLAAIAFGARKGEMSGPTLNGNIYTMARVSDERMMPDSVGARHILLSRTNAASADSLVSAIKGGKSIFELAPLYSVDQTVDLGIFPPHMMVEPFAEAVIAARSGDVITVETQYGTHVVEMTYKTPPVRKAQIAMITYNVDPSAATQQGVYNQAREFLTVAAGSKDNFDAAASQTGTSRRIATIAENDKNVRGLNDSRELVRWSYNAKKGTVSPIFEIDGDYVVAVVTDAKDAGIADVNEAAYDIANKLRNDKKAGMLAQRLSGKSLDEAASLEGAKEGEMEGVTFSSYYIPELGLEPAVIGAMDDVSPGTLSKPVKGLSGMFLVWVYSADRVDDATEASERVRLEATAQTSLLERTAQALMEESDIVDNRAKFF